MARTHNTNEQNETEQSATNGEPGATPAAFDPASLPDNAIYMSVDGYIGFLPMVNYDQLSAAENVAINEGRKQIALRKAQTVAKKAKAANTDVRVAVQNFLSTFNPDAETEFQTVAGKRAEIARELLSQRLAAAGKPNDEATIEKNLAAFMQHARHSVTIGEQMAAWATAYTVPKKRGSAASGEGGSDVDLDSLE